MEKSTVRKRVAAIHARLRAGHISWRDAAVAIGPLLLILTLGTWAALHFVQPAPPDKIFITSGPDGSAFRRYADRYRQILARRGITLEVLASEGAVENLKRLTDSGAKVDVGFVQGGVAATFDVTNVVSLGSIAYEPLVVFYRGRSHLDTLSQLSGKRIAIGRVGSGTHALASALLKANGISEGGETQLVAIGGERAVSAMLDHEIDAAFLTGDSASGATMGKLLRARGVQLFDFVQAEGYARRFRYLSKLELPRGSIDFGRDLPRENLSLMAPTVELIARQGLHPALSDLLIEAAREVHGRANLMQNAHEFPAPLEREYPISSDAARYYKSGKSFVYRYLPFWVASLVDRTIFVLIPIVVLLVPGMRLVPALYGWRIRSRIFRRYAQLMALERETLEPLTPERRETLQARLAAIEKAVIRAKIPGSHADELYVLREHMSFVASRLQIGAAGPASVPPIALTPARVARS
jgi:hypothetical protein